MVESARDFFNHMTSLDSFEANENVWFSVYPDKQHTTENWYGRLWSSFQVLRANRN